MFSRPLGGCGLVGVWAWQPPSLGPYWGEEREELNLNNYAVPLS